MSVGPLSGVVAGAAGSPLAQTKGAAAERALDHIAQQRRTVYHEEKAAAAAGVGEPDGENHETAERGGNGNRPWEELPEPEADREPRGARRSPDPTLQSGNLLDLTG